MKKLFILFVCFFMFVSCATITKDGKQCFSTQSFEVLQGLIGGALAYECPWYEDMCWTRPVVYLTSPDGVDYYDDQKVSIPYNLCWSQDGVYRYITKNKLFMVIYKTNCLWLYL